MQEGKKGDPSKENGLESFISLIYAAGYVTCFHKPNAVSHLILHLCIYMHKYMGPILLLIRRLSCHHLLTMIITHVVRTKLYMLPKWTWQCCKIFTFPYLLNSVAQCHSDVSSLGCLLEQQRSTWSHSSCSRILLQCAAVTDPGPKAWYIYSWHEEQRDILWWWWTEAVGLQDRLHGLRVFVVCMARSLW